MIFHLSFNYMHKLLLIALLASPFIVILLLIFYLLNFSQPEVSYGVTFTKNYAQYELGLDWQKTYLAILDDLKVDHIRLSAYWNVTQPAEGVYDYDDLDWQVSEASKRGVKIILAVGRRLPRWPECHDPSWIGGWEKDKIATSQLAFVRKTVERYKDNPNIIYWQVENEPYLGTFGICPPLDKANFKNEIKLVKELTGKPILITDSGELSTWIPAARSGGDLLGTTMYRVVYDKRFGYFSWFLPPSTYYFKAQLVKALTGIDKIIVAELQTESWHPENTTLAKISQKEIDKSLSVEKFKNNIEYARQAGFSEIYLWGPEWWYYMKTVKGNAGYWDEAKNLWR